MQYLTVAETAERLGVKRETVYAYVSRGMLTSVRSAQRRGSRFAQDEVEGLAARGREAGEPSGSVERIRTSISLLGDGGPYYRGVHAGDLARSGSLEEVAGLLWETSDPPEFRADPGLLEVARGTLAALPSGARLTDRIRVAVAAQAAADPLRADISEVAVTRTAAALLGTTIAALAAAPRTGCGDRERPAADATPGPIADRLWPVLVRPAPKMPGSHRTATTAPASTGPGPIRLLDAALVLLADHGLAVSTVAARVAASARADVHAVVSAGLGALDGRDHGLVSSLAHRFLAEAMDDPVAALGDRLRAGVRVPGFGHRIYRGPDPRAQVLFALLREDPTAERVLTAVDAVVAGMARGPSPEPNVDLALAAFLHAHHLRADAGEAMFAVARTVGWVAHALEEYREPGLRFRPAGVYVGPRPD
ncbi:MAG: citrate synthase [Pseudonocardia sp.]|nr:citrate synthase [Pseudonocardia sp.]